MVSSGGGRPFGDSFLPLIEMFQDMLDQQPFIDEADDLHLAAAFGAFQRVDFPLFFNALAPAFRWDFLLLRFGYVENVYCSNVTTCCIPLLQKTLFAPIAP